MHRWQTIGEMLQLTLPNKVEYCRRHGYSLHVEEWTESLFPGFERLPVLIHLLKCGRYDWIFWLGSDCLITNLDRRLELLVDRDYGIIAATDFTQLQLDSFLIQKGRRGLEVMERVWAHRDHPLGQYYEQSTLDTLMNTPEFKGTVKLVPQRMMNSYQHKWYGDFALSNRLIADGKDIQGNSGRWQPGDFVFHIPGRPFATKLRALREVASLIQR